MKNIALIAVAAVLLLELSGALSKSSVGGAMTLGLVYLVAALAVGLHEAWSNKRGALGWIVSGVVSLVGGILGSGCGNVIMVTLLMLLQFEGSLAATRHPLLYVSLAGVMIFTLLGAWIALWIVNRFRQSPIVR